MKQSTLEPGLLQMFRLYMMVVVVALPVVLRMLGVSVGIDLAWKKYLLLILPVPIFLVIYTTLPGWQRLLGSAFLPAGLTLFAVHVLFEKYVTLAWLVTPSLRELAMLLLMLRLWLVFQLVLVFVAWQYNLFWVTVSGITLCLLDSALGLPFVNRNSPLYPVYLVIVPLRLVAVTGIGLGLAWLIKRQREQRAALAQTNQKLAEANQKLAQFAATNEQLAVSQERIRLARELHDTLAHSLSSITVQLEAAESIWELDMSKARTLLDGALGNTRNGLIEARRALQALRAGALEEVGLRVAVGDLARSAAARGNLILDLKVPEELPNLTQAEEQCVYRVAQEALSNVTRHARATHVRVELQHAPGGLTLTITDDGKGFDPAQVNGGHFGLKGLHERADLVGAKLEVLSQQQRGTTLTLHAPITEMGS